MGKAMMGKAADSVMNPGVTAVSAVTIPASYGAGPGVGR